MVNDVNGEIDRKIDRVDVRFVINTRVEKGAFLFLFLFLRFKNGNYS